MENPNREEDDGFNDEDWLLGFNEDEKEDAMVRHEKYLAAIKTWDDSEEYKEAIRQMEKGKGGRPDFCRYHQHDDSHPPCYKI